MSDRKIEFNYLYEFNKSRYERAYSNELKEKTLTTYNIKNAIILPARQDNCSLFGLGGVINEEKQYIKESGIISKGRYIYNDIEAETNVFGGLYQYNQKDLINIKKKVVYLGYISNHWGHFLVDFSTRLWYFLKNDDKNLEYVYVIKENAKFELINNIKRFFSLLGLDINRIHFINKPTKFDDVIVPEPSYITNKYYSQEFLEIFDRVAESVQIDNTKKYEGCYLTRSNWYKSKNTEIGEDVLIQLFKENGYKIVSPEKLTLDEQIRYIRQSKIVAGITGTITHNMLFAQNNQKLVIFNKTYNFNSMQKDINIIRKLDITYVDSYISILPVPLGNGPFNIIYNENMEKYIKDNKLDKKSTEVYSEYTQKRNLKKFNTILREEIEAQRCEYVTDENNSAYFNPEHILYYYKNWYFKVYPINMKEKVAKNIIKMKSLIGKIKFRLTDKLKQIKTNN